MKIAVCDYEKYFRDILIEHLDRYASIYNYDFFYRSHRSFIVNFKHIKSYSNTIIIFENGEKAMLTKTKYAKFQKEYMLYLKRERTGVAR